MDSARSLRPPTAERRVAKRARLRSAVATGTALGRVRRARADTLTGLAGVRRDRVRNSICTNRSCVARRMADRAADTVAIMPRVMAVPGRATAADRIPLRAAADMSEVVEAVDTPAVAEVILAEADTASKLM
jgi:hypothetical protein